MEKNLVSLLQSTVLKWKNHPAFAMRTGKSFVFRSFEDLFKQVTEIAAYLIHQGLKKGDRVAIISDNRWEWIVASLGITFSGGVDVPRGSDATEADLFYILNHSEARYAFVESQSILDRILKKQEMFPLCEDIFLFSPSSKRKSLIDLCKEGEKILLQYPNIVNDRVKEIQPNDLVTMIYTSGTTGNPKGVMLTHLNFVSQIQNVPIHISSDERILSILPVWHIFERIFEYIALYSGACTYYSNVKSLREDLKIVKPTFMASAPRLWESLYHAIQSQIQKARPSQKWMFSLGLRLARIHKTSLLFFQGRVDGHELKRPGHPFFAMPLFGLVYLLSHPLYQFFDLLVFRKIRSQLGGHLKGSVSGGGALPFYIDLFFLYIGIQVLEGYGMTESAPILAMRVGSDSSPGTVGRPFPNTEIQLIDPDTKRKIHLPYQKGEIWAKGLQIMKGYYKESEKTEQVFENGWLKTGDLGMFTERNELKIVGRIKETIVLLGGENVEPVPIEAKLLESPAIEQCIVVGQDKKYLTALVLPRIDFFKEYGEDLQSIRMRREVKDAIKKEIQKRNSQDAGFKSFERVVDFYLLEKPFAIGEELTAKLSLKRNVIAERYADKIAKMYED